MNIPFYPTLVSILSEQEEINGFPNNELLAANPLNYPDGTLIPFSLQPKQFIVFARLQTLLFLENKKCNQPIAAETQCTATLIGADFATTAIAELSLIRESQKRCVMLERFFVEAVRSYVPAETEHLNYIYRFTRTGQIIRIPTISHHCD